MTAFVRTVIQVIRFTRNQERNTGGWIGLAAAGLGSGNTSPVRRTMGVERNSRSRSRSHSPRFYRQSEYDGAGETYSETGNSSFNSISPITSITPVELSSLERTGGNLVMLGAYVEPVTAEVTSKEIFQGTAVNEDDSEATREDEPAVKKILLCRQPFIVLILILLVVVLTVSVWVSVKLLVGPNETSSTIPTPPPFQEGIPSSTITTPPTLAPTSAPTSPELSEFLTDLVMRLHVPNADRLSQEPNSPQHMAARWMTEVDEYVPTNDDDLLQRYVLVVFYYSTKESSVAWRTGCGFLDPTTHVCEWNCDWADEARFIGDWITDVDAHRMGVFCPLPEEVPEEAEEPSSNSTITRTVAGLQLISNSLDGTVPAQELGLLSNLAVLNLSWNDLTGFFELSQLPASLEYVSFIANQFQTSLQENRGVNCLERLCNIGRLVNLKSLRLTDKEETDFSEHDTLQNTQVLGTMPTEIGELTNLELLTLEDLRLAGSLPTELGQLTQLTHLALSHNELTGFVPTQLSYLTNLQELALESNENLKGTLEGLCGAERNQSNNMNGTTVDFSSDCLLTSIACTCCRTCCHPNGDCQDMMLNDAEEWQQQQQQVP